MDAHEPEVAAACPACMGMAWDDAGYPLVVCLRCGLKILLTEDGPQPLPHFLPAFKQIHV